MQLPMELTDTTNEGFQYLIGQRGGLEIGAQAWFFLPFNDPFRTSDLQLVEFSRPTPGSLKMVCHTLNSSYTFESTQDAG